MRACRDRTGDRSRGGGADRRWRTYRDFDVGSAAGSTRSRPIFTCEWCFGPLEVAYDYEAIARRDQPGEDRRRSAEPSGATRTCCRSSANPAVDLGAGFTPLVRADRLAAELGLGELWIKNDTREPDELVQGPRHVGRAVEGARVRLQDRGLRVDRQPRQLGRRARGARRAAQLRVHPREPRAGQDRHDRGLRRQRRRDRRQLRRRQPALRRARRHVPVGVRERERAHVLRRGLEDARVRDRRAARLGDARPRRRADGERFAAHEDPQGLRRAAQGRAARRASRRCGCPARRRSAARRSRRRGSSEHRQHQAGEAGHDRQVARDRQPGRRLLRARRRAPDRRRVRGGHRRRDRRRDAAARPDRGDLRRDRRRRDDRDAEAARRSRVSSGPTSASSPTSPATA